MQDQLVDCKRCGGNACYEQHIGTDAATWLCMGCGFSTSTVMDKDGEVTKQTLDTSPELYKDLMFVDPDNKAWFPSTITLPAKGMVFLDGTDPKDWRWAAVKAVEITEEDRKLKQFPADQTHRMDMQNASYFDQKGFMDALELIGFYDVN